VAHRLRQIKGCLGSIFVEKDSGLILYADRREAEVDDEPDIIQTLIDLSDSISDSLPLGDLARVTTHYEKFQKVFIAERLVYVIIFFDPDVNFEEVHIQVKRNLDRM